MGVYLVGRAAAEVLDEVLVELSLQSALQPLIQYF